MVENTAKLQEKIMALTNIDGKGGIDILTNTGEFKSTYDILLAISKVWKEMDDTSQASLLELVAGKTRGSVVAALFQNGDVLEKAYESASSASGSAMNELNTYLDSIQGRIDTFNNSLQTMWMNFIDSKVVKGFVDFGTSLINLVDDIGVFKTALLGVGVYFTAIKKNNPVTMFKDLITTLTNYNSTVQHISSIGSVIGPLNSMSMELFNAGPVNAYAAAVANMTAKQQAATLAASGLNSEQIASVLAVNGLDAANIKLAMSEAQVAQAKTQTATATGLQIATTIQQQGTTLSQNAANFLLKHSTEQVTKAMLAKAVVADEITHQEAVLILKSMGVVAANNAQAFSWKALGTAIKSAFMSNPVGMILTIATTILSIAIPAISALTTSTEEAARAAEEAMNAYEDTKKTLRDQKNTIDELSASYEKLSRGVDLNTNENLNLTTQSYEEYLNICNEIADMYPHLVTGFDAQGNAILSLKGNVDELIQAYKDAAQLARQKMIVDGSDVFDVFKTNYSRSAATGLSDTGLSRQAIVAKRLQELISNGNQDEINTFFKEILGNNNLVIDGKAYNRVDLGAFFDSAGIEYDKWSLRPDFVNSSYEVDVDELKKSATKILSFVKSTTTQINVETSKVKSLMDAYLGEDLVYASYSDRTRILIDKIVSGFNAEFINGFDSADSLYSWIKTNIVDAFKDSSVVDTIVDLSNLQLEFAGGDINYADYAQKLTEYLSKIQNKFDDDTLNQIKIGIGIDETSLKTAENHIKTFVTTTDINSKIKQLSVEDLQIASELEVPEDTIYTWEQLIKKIEEAKIAATQDFEITDHTEAITAHSAAISEFQEAIQKLGKGSFTMDDFMGLIKKYPKLAKGVDVSSNAFYGLSRNLNRAIKANTKSFIKDLKELRVSLVAAGKSTESIDQLIDAVENMPGDALDDTIERYQTLANEIDRAKLAQDQLLASMEENPNEGYESRGEAMEYMKEAMEKGEIGSESNLWNVAEKYGFTYDSAKTINENADALAEFIAIREKWFKQSDDGDGRTDDGYSHEGAINFIEAVEKVVEESEAAGTMLAKILDWDYDETTGTFAFDFDNKDLPEIISLLSQTKELVGLTEQEWMDLMVQVGQYFGIDWGDYQDAKDYLDGIANGTSDAKTKVEEYGKAMQDYFGEDTEIDLSNRKIVTGDAIREAGWSFDGKDSTLFSQVDAGNVDGTVQIVATPVLPDGKILDEERFNSFIDQIAAGTDPAEIKFEFDGKDYTGDDIFLKKFEGKDALEQASQYHMLLGEVLNQYNQLKDTLNIETTINESGLAGLEKIPELQDAIDKNSDGTVLIDEEAFQAALIKAEYTEDQIDRLIQKIKEVNGESFNIDNFKIDEALEKNGIEALKQVQELQVAIKEDVNTGITIFDTDMFASILRDAGYTETKIDELIKKVQEYDGVVSVARNTDPLGLQNAGLTIDALKASLNTLGIEFDESIGKWFDGSTELKINVEDLVTTLKAKGWSDEAIKAYCTQLSENVDIEGFNINVTGIENIDEVIETANKVPEEETTQYEVTGTGAATVKGINDEWAKVPTTKSTEYTITETTVKKTEDKTNDAVWYNPFTWFADGTAHAQGTAYSEGSWGAPETETALVGELGPELLVRNGRWTTVGENGAEFTQVKKGDIIFNHKQTESLLKNGYVTGRGKAYASGTAFADGGGTFARYEFSGSGGYQKLDVNDNVVDSFGDLSGAADAISDALDDAADSVNEFEETIDWIEIRMEEFDERIGKLSAELENLTTYEEKNAKISEIVAENQKKYADSLAGAKYYEDYAKQYLDGMNSTLVEAAKNGAIAITEFTKEQDEATVNAIQNYRDYAQKAADLHQQAEEIITEIADLAKQAFDNIVNDFENELSFNDIRIEQYEAHNSLLETDKGFASEDIYQKIIEENEAKLKILEQQRAAMQTELDSGKIEVGSDDWYDAVNAISEVNTEIVNLNTEIEDLQDSINELHWEKFDLLMTQFEAVSDEAENLLDILNTKDAVDELGNWTDEGITSLGLLAQQMEVAEMQAEKYKNEIAYLNKNWKSLGYTQAEYVEKLDELKSGQYDAINAYHDAKDAILELNEARVDAIKDGIEKEIDAYSELIEKKKDALDAEKDLYDFQQTVEEKSKNIADIQRKLAALSNDNSASARAQRAKLEAELYEAQADLEDTYYDRSVSNQQDALDRELENFQETKEAEIEELDKYLENLELVVSDSLAVVQENTSAVLATLQAMQTQYGLTVTSALIDPWKAGELAIQEYGAKLNISLTALAAMFGMTVDEFAAKLGMTTEALVGSLDITVAQMAESLGLTSEQLAAKLGITVTSLNGMLNLTIQELAATLGITLPALAEKLGTTTVGLAGNLDMTIAQFAGKMGLTVSELSSKFGITAQDLANKLSLTYQELTSPFGLSMSATVDALKALETEYSNILASIKGDSKIAVDEVNKAMQKYEGAKEQKPQVAQKPSKQPAKTPVKQQSTSVGSKINAGNAKIYADSYGGGGGKQYYASDPNYVVLDEQNGYILVRHHKLKSGYTGWFKKSDLPKYASGTIGTKKDQWAILDELGDELQLIPGANGRLEYVKKGTGIVPADLTERLIGLAMDPQEMLDRNRPTIAPSNSVVNTEITLDCSVGTMVNIEHCDQSTLPDVEKIVNKAFDKHMQTLNNSIRKFTR